MRENIFSSTQNVIVSNQLSQSTIRFHHYSCILCIENQDNQRSQYTSSISIKHNYEEKTLTRGKLARLNE